MINRALQLILYWLLLATYTSAQETIKDTFYKRMEGDTDSLLIQANIIRLADQLSGNYELSSDIYETETFEIDGKVQDNNQALIRQLGKNDPIFEGVFVDDQFTGLWHGDTEGKTINLIESYPDGSIPLDIHYLRSEAKLINDKIESPSAEIELTIVYPVEGTINKRLLQNINNILCNYFNIQNSHCIHPDSLLMHTEDAFFKLYREQNSDWYEGGNSFDWLKETSMSVNYNSNYILCFEYLDYVYTGGAHGMTKQSYRIFNIKSGDLITFQDIFINDSEDSLSNLLTSQIRSDQQIPDSIQLDHAGYFLNKIQPSENIYINGSGIGFVYNQYEIAPYSTGISNIFLTYDKLKGLINENSLIFYIAEKY